jgi:hypothetical protein
MAAVKKKTSVQKSLILNVLTSIKRENQAILRGAIDLGEIDCIWDLLAQIRGFFPLFLIKRLLTV